MLPKNKRVSRKTFAIVSRLKGKTFYSPFLSVKVIAEEKNYRQHSIFSFVVSGKVSKKATVRNLLRRRGYASIRAIAENTRQGFVCIFYFKKPILSLSYKKLQEEIHNILKKSGVAY